MSKDLGDLSATELEILAMLQDETTKANPSVTLTNGDKQVTATTATIAKLWPHVTSETVECEVMSRGIATAAMLTAYVCGHGTVHIELKDEAETIFATAGMDPRLWMEMVADVESQLEGLVIEIVTIDDMTPESGTRH